MRHERSCHVFKGFVGTCAVCGERFTTSKLLWNAIKLWNDQCSVKSCQPYFENDVIGPQGTSIVRRSPRVSRIPYKSGQLFPHFLKKKS